MKSTSRICIDIFVTPRSNKFDELLMSVIIFVLKQTPSAQTSTTVDNEIQKQLPINSDTKKVRIGIVPSAVGTPPEAVSLEISVKGCFTSMHNFT